MSDTKRILLAEINTDTIKAQNENILETDFQVSRDVSMVRITIAVSGTSALKLIPSTGTRMYLNNDSSLPDLSVFTQDVHLDPGRTWNLHFGDASGATVLFLRIIELEGVS